MSIQVEHVNKQFGAFDALRDVSMEVRSGELLAILGPSGSGKTTLLRIIAGLDFADSGRIALDGQNANDVAARQRRVGFVFQHYAMFRHMTVFENVAFGLRVKPRRDRPSEEKIRAKVNQLLELVQLEQFADRYPNQLSGGQRQRVALARVLAIDPHVLLLDEPFGALDAKVRKELRGWLRRLHDEMHVTSVLVTHDQEEAMEVADRIVVMSQGRIEQEGTPAEVYRNPNNAFVYHFLGNASQFQADVKKGRVVIDGASFAADFATKVAENAAVQAWARPYEIAVNMAPPKVASIAATVRHINVAGSLVRVEAVTESGSPIVAEVSHEAFDALGVQKNAPVWLVPERLRVF